MIVHGCSPRLMSGMDVSPARRAASPNPPATNHAPPSPRSTAAHSRVGRCQPCNRSRPTNDVRAVAVRARGDHHGRDRREAGLTAFGSALTIRRSRGRWSFRRPTAAWALFSFEFFTPLRAVADSVRRGRAERSGLARPRASSARAPAR
jgi:hypothetical protein